MNLENNTFDKYWILQCEISPFSIQKRKSYQSNLVSLRLLVPYFIHKTWNLTTCCALVVVVILCSSVWCLFAKVFSPLSNAFLVDWNSFSLGALLSKSMLIQRQMPAVSLHNQIGGTVSLKWWLLIKIKVM